MATTARMTPKDIDRLRFMLKREANKLHSGSPGVGKMDYSDDFTTFYGATDDISSTSATGSANGAQALQELQFLSEKRIGLGYSITHGFAEDALYNWFNPKKVDAKSTVVVPGLNKWTVDTNFKNQSIIWDAHKRIYGIGMLVKFWTAHDKMDQPPPRNKPPKMFQVIPPTYLSPTNTFDTRMIDYDEEMWEFMGGNLRIKKIHKDRIEVIRGKPKQDDWTGISVLDPIYLSLICYYNAIINITRGLAKWGDMVPVIKSGSITPTPDEYTEFLDLMKEFRANGFFFLGRDDQLEFPSSNVGQGIYQTLEFLKEDIASGTRIPLNTLFGRSESGGIGDGGALTAERKYLNLLANEQTQISDDLIRIFTDAGFDFEGLELGWNLALTKTTEQKLLEEQMKLNNDLLKQQLHMMRKENTMMKAQQELFDQHKHEFTAEQQLQTAEQIKEDFKYTKKRFDDFKKLQNLISIKGRYEKND